MRGTSDTKTGDMTRQERLDRAEEITLWEAEDLTHRAVLRLIVGPLLFFDNVASIHRRFYRTTVLSGCGANYDQ
jgi:hypothetical protein